MGLQLIYFWIRDVCYTQHLHSRCCDAKHISKYLSSDHDFGAILPQKRVRDVIQCVD